MRLGFGVPSHPWNLSPACPLPPPLGDLRDAREGIHQGWEQQSLLPWYDCDLRRHCQGWGTLPGMGRIWIYPIAYLPSSTPHPPLIPPSGTYQGMIERLDYLQELGVNAVELLPVQV